MNNAPPIAQEAIELARRGDTAGALEAAHKAVASHPDDYGLRLFIGLLHSRRLELDDALPHVQRAVSLAPSDPIPRVELVRLLIGLGRLDEAERELAAVRLPGLEPDRLQAMIHARRNQHEQATQILRGIVAADPRDHESWGNLGGCLIASGRAQLAIEPLARALQLRPDLQKFREKLMEAQVEARQGEEALVNARKFAGENPGDISAWLTVSRLEDLLGRPEQALDVLKDALAAHPDHVPALVAFARLLERQNRIDEFAGTIARIERLAPEAPELGLLRAQLAFRTGELHQSLELAEAAPDALDRGTRAELIGKIQDRLGNSQAAFRAFKQMNEVSDLSPETIAERSRALRDLIDDRARITTAEWVRGWPAQHSEMLSREPAFLIGFPRSGTTLLDTFLMGHPAVCVAEEKPLLETVFKELSSYERLATLDETEIGRLRDCYFEAAANYVPDLGDRLLVDKFPLGALDAALIHRLFPKARIIFSQRHPCDVVLSCFFTRFQPTSTLVSFYTLQDTAMLYARVMAFWEQCRAAMTLDVHEIQYEDLVRDPEAQVRALLSFLALEWDDRATRHEAVAERRSFIGTGSYAQVVEPLYDRSIGRWSRYRDELAGVLPLLEPWALKMGYSI